MSKGNRDISVIFHYPQTDEGLRLLAERTARSHGEAAGHYIRKLKCSSKQKELILKMIMEASVRG